MSNPLHECPPSEPSVAFVLDWIAEDTNTFDLDLAHVAGAHPDRGLTGVADARGGAGDEEVAGLEGNRLCHVNERFDDGKHHVGRVVRLHHLAVEPALDLEPFARRWQLVGRHHPRPKASGTIEVLAHVPLTGPPLKLA